MKKSKLIAFVILLIVIAATIIITHFLISLSLSMMTETNKVLISMYPRFFRRWCVGAVEIEIIIYQAISYYFLDDEVYHTNYYKFILALIALGIISFLIFLFFYPLISLEALIFLVELSYLISWIKHRFRKNKLNSEEAQQ